MLRRCLLSLLLNFAASMFLVACSGESTPAAPAATETPSPSPIPTWTLVPPTPSATPPATATPLPDLSAGDAVIAGGVVYTRAEPSTQSAQVGSIAELAPVRVANRVQGENWLLGQQTWLSTTPAWATEWFQLEDGSYVYGPFVFILREGETSPLAPVPEGAEKWIDVDVSEQTARAMVGDQAVFTAPISSGEPRFATPMGSLAIEPDGRIAVVRMTASQAGYDPGQATYDVERVLFTQYFDQKGNALHLNYWRPHSVFGNTPTSHGCVGMELHEAQWFWLFGEPGMRVEIHE
jgi:lipoprotein-anchoring transpeptidase ErfK/SrfK